MGDTCVQGRVASAGTGTDTSQFVRSSARERSVTSGETRGLTSAEHSSDSLCLYKREVCVMTQYSVTVSLGLRKIKDLIQTDTHDVN